MSESPPPQAETATRKPQPIDPKVLSKSSWFVIDKIENIIDSINLVTPETYKPKDVLAAASVQLEPHFMGIDQDTLELNDDLKVYLGMRTKDFKTQINGCHKQFEALKKMETPEEKERAQSQIVKSFELGVMMIELAMRPLEGTGAFAPLSEEAKIYALTFLVQDLLAYWQFLDDYNAFIKT